MKFIYTLIFVLLVHGVSYAQTEKQQAYTFGVFPYMSMKTLGEIFEPVGQNLSDVVGKEISLHTETTHKQFLKKLNNEYFDFVLIPPFWYPVAVDKMGYLPAVRMKEPFVSVVLVLDKSRIFNISDLKGKVIATPPASSPVVKLAIRKMVSSGVVPGRDVRLESNETAEACIRMVLNERASACISPTYAVSYVEENISDALRIVMRSSAIPSVSLVIHSRVPETDRKKIINQFVAWKDSEQGAALLDAMQVSEFVPVIDSEYDVVRELLRGAKPFH